MAFSNHMVIFEITQFMCVCMCTCVCVCVCVHMCVCAYVCVCDGRGMLCGRTRPLYCVCVITSGRNWGTATEVNRASEAACLVYADNKLVVVVVWYVLLLYFVLLY